MADTNVPQGGRYPSRQELQRQLGPIFGDAANLGVDRRTLYGKQAERIFNDDLTAQDMENGYVGAGMYYAPAAYDISQTASDDVIAQAGGAAPRFVEWDVPTSSTNYQRPRTVAAGYSPNDEDPNNGVMTVVFRDGTFYNYYQVSPIEWSAFHSSFSKGKPWLNRKNSQQAADGLFIGKPRGNADISDLDKLDPRIRENLYRVARVQQQKAGAKVGRTKQTVYKTGGGAGAHYGLEQSPRGRKRQTLDVPNTRRADSRRNYGANPAKNAGTPSKRRAS